MLLECPHCYRTVVTLPDDHCPTCHRDTNDLTGTDPDRTLLYVSDTTDFPNACCLCNERTDRTVKVSESGRIAERAPSPVIQISPGHLISLLGLIAISIFGTDDKSFLTAKLTVRVPQCDACAFDNRLEAEIVDLEHRRFGLIVNRRFAYTVKELNAAGRWRAA